MEILDFHGLFRVAIKVGVTVVAITTLYFMWRWWPRRPGDGPVPVRLPGMSLATKRLAPTPTQSLVLSIRELPVAQGAGLLAYMTRLPGVRVVATKADSDSDSFDGFFVYKERLYSLETGFLRNVIGLRGEPPDEAAFAEVERHVQSYSWPQWVLTLGTQLRFLFLPRAPPLDKYRPFRADEGRSVASRPASRGSDDGIDPVAEAEVFLAFGHRKEAIALLEQAAEENPANDDVRRRLLELKAGSQ